jgi:hypothetical protein
MGGLGGHILNIKGGVAKTWQEVHGHMELLQTQYFGQ